MTNNKSKIGFPVLAYSTSHSASSWLCKFIFKHSESQATISLQSQLSIYGHEDEQTFYFQYDASNLVPGTTSLGPASIPLPQTQLDKIVRHADPQIRTLSLSLMKSCPIWCPLSVESIAPKPGFDTPFDELVKLAKANELNIVFDYNWLHKDHRPPFQRLVSKREVLGAFPVGQYYSKNFKLVDWTDFNPIDATQPPPTYADASNKRPRPGKSSVLNKHRLKPISHTVSSSSPPSSPPSKRAIIDDFEASSQTRIPTSPTERATASSFQGFSPKRRLDSQSVAINSAVARQLPFALEQVLPKILMSLFTTAPTPSPQNSRSVPVPVTTGQSPPTLSPLGDLLVAHMYPHLLPHLDSLYDLTYSSASELRENADAEFFESCEDAKLELMMVRDEGVDNLQAVGIDVMEECRGRAEEAVDDAEARALEASEVMFKDMQDRIRCGRCESTVRSKAKAVRARGSRSRSRGGKGGYRGLGIR